MSCDIHLLLLLVTIPNNICAVAVIGHFVPNTDQAMELENPAGIYPTLIFG